MGDSGSLFIGIVNSIFAIRFINFQNPLLLNLNIIETSIVAVSIFYIPLFDAVRVFVLRALKGRSPFSADTNHIHHIFLRKGHSHYRISLILLLISFLITFFVWLLQPTGINLITAVLVLFGFFLSMCLSSMDKKL